MTACGSGFAARKYKRRKEFSFWSDNNKAKITLGKQNEAKKMKRNKAK
jgi:hypothetical protein